MLETSSRTILGLYRLEYTTPSTVFPTRLLGWLLG